MTSRQVQLGESKVTNNLDAWTLVMEKIVDPREPGYLDPVKARESKDPAKRVAANGPSVVMVRQVATMALEALRKEMGSQKPLEEFIYEGFSLLPGYKWSIIKDQKI